MTIYTTLVVAVASAHVESFKALLRSIDIRPTEIREAKDKSLIVLWTECVGFSDSMSHQAIVGFLASLPRNEYDYQREDAEVTVRGSMGSEYFAFFDDVEIRGKPVDPFVSNNRKRIFGHK